jgi:geranylgeranyl diphosphate synthase type II
MLSFEEYAEIAESHLPDFFPEENSYDKVIIDAMKYSLSAGGKRLRPVLTLAACDFAGGDINDALPFACAMEYIHTYSLIHDDLPAMDDDDMRRGKPSNHAVYGAGMATLAGDGLLNLAFETIINDIASCAGDPDRMTAHAKAGRAIAEGSGVRGMVGGQAVDIENQKYPASEETLLYIDRNKTAALIKAALLAGAYAGGADDSMISSFGRYGDDIGTAFQIADDILNVTGTEEEMGKPVGDDADDDKMTYVSMYGMDEAKRMLEKYTDDARDVFSGSFFSTLADRLARRSR